MRDLCRLIGWMVVDLIRSRATLEAGIWTLRQQINVLRRGAPRKLSFCAVDRMIFVGLYRMFPKICDALAIVKPDTVVRGHRADFVVFIDDFHYIEKSVREDIGKEIRVFRESSGWF